MSAYVLPVDITPSSAERIFGRAKTDAASPIPDTSRAARGLRIARQRDPIFLAALERFAEVMVQLGEDQHGASRRAGKTAADRLEANEVQMARQAYVCADRGQPEPAFGYLYLAVAEHEGLS